MEVKIYQINMERDENRVCFMGVDSLPRFQGTGQIDSSIYDLVFAGDVPCSDLEGVYRMFNIDHPDGYTGRSLSVSDVVQIQNGSTDAPCFHYCDSIGFKEVQFDPELTRDATKPGTIKVVLVEPGKLARTAEIPATLEGMQAVVKGSIEAFYPFEEEVCIVCNGEGKITGMPLNRAVYSEEIITDMSYSEMTGKFYEAERSGTGQHLTGYIVFSQDSFKEPYKEAARTYVVSSNNKAFMPGMGGYSIYGSAMDGSDPCVRLERYMQDEKGGADGWKIERCYMKESEREMIEIMAGPFFVCDCSGESFDSLNDDQLKKYTELFKQPERFARVNDEIVAVPYNPNKTQER